MLFEISLDLALPVGKKVLTDSGHIISFSPALINELESLDINPKIFAEIVLEFLKENSRHLSTYIKPLPKKQGCKYYARVIDLWLHYPLRTHHVLFLLINYDEISEILILDPQVFQLATDKLLDYAASKDCLKVSMPYLYKFVVFETFNTFKKKFSVKFEGVIGDNEKYLVALDENSKALLWKIDSPQLEYMRNFTSEKILYKTG